MQPFPERLRERPSSMVIHRSSPNLTEQLRRAYLLQYSDEIITDAEGQQPWGSFEHFLHEGQPIAVP